jgi:competence protein CoiA
VEAARDQGWEAETELADVSPSGERWQADVLARKNGLRVAIEIQWSSQTVEETLRRQERYRQSGVRCLWLLQKNGLPVSKELPAAQITDSGDGLFRALLSSGQSIPVRTLLDAAFSGRFKFGVPLGGAATVSVRIGSMPCWHDACRAQTNIVTGVDVMFGPNVSTFTIADLGSYPDLFAVINDRIPSDRQIGAIKERFSSTQARAYLSNGCYRCDRIIGEFFEHSAYEDQDVVCSFPIRLSKPWIQAIDKHYSYDDSWAVYPVEVLPPQLG